MVDILNTHHQEVIDKASKIKAILFDVDGVLTDGGIIYGSSGEEFKKFNVIDGLIIKLLKKEGFFVGVITGRKSNIINVRMDELQVDCCYQGVENKLATYVEIKEKHFLEDYQIAYVGDDLPDVGIINKCGLGVMPNDSPSYLHKHADYISRLGGGKGVIREVGELILTAQNKLDGIIQNHLEGNFIDK